MLMNPCPNFLIIGAQKAGTTSLHEYLNQHPNIFMSQPKEPHFFSKDECFSVGIKYYQRFFEQLGKQKRIGEASTSYTIYLDLEKVVKRIYAFNKNMKLIYILRSPIKRAYSAYWWNVRGVLEDLSFEDAIAQEEKRINKVPREDPYSYKRRGLYFHIISTYLKYFPRENLEIVFLDDLQASPIDACNKIFDFLCIEKFKITKLEKQNPATLPKSKTIQKLISYRNPLRTTLSTILTHTGAGGKRAKDRLYKFIKGQNLELFDYPPMKESTFDYLANYFEDDIKQLEKFTNRNLSHWSQSKKK